MDVVYIQIRASDIDFWKTNFDTMKLQHERRIYPPRVKMTIMLKDSKSRKLLVRFVGSSNDNQLNTELPLPLGMIGVKSNLNIAIYDKFFYCSRVPMFKSFLIYD